MAEKFHADTGNVDARYNELYAIMYWYPVKIGTVTKLLLKGRTWVQINFRNSMNQKEFMLNLLKDEPYRNAIQQEFNLQKEQMEIIDKLAQKLRELEEASDDEDNPKTKPLSLSGPE